MTPFENFDVVLADAICDLLNVKAVSELKSQFADDLSHGISQEFAILNRHVAQAPDEETLLQHIDVFSNRTLGVFLMCAQSSYGSHIFFNHRLYNAPYRAPEGILKIVIDAMPESVNLLHYFKTDYRVH